MLLNATQLTIAGSLELLQLFFLGDVVIIVTVVVVVEDDFSQQEQQQLAAFLVE